MRGAAREGRSPTSIARRALIGLAIGAGAALLAALLGQLRFAAGIENNAYDLRVRRGAEPLRASSPVVIVDINESSVRELEPMLGRMPWPRVVHASAIDYLARSGAKVIVYDLIFGERDAATEAVINGQTFSGADSDRALVASVKAAGNVVLLADATFAGFADPAVAREPPPQLPGVVYHPGHGFQARPSVRLPFPELASVAIGVGHNLAIRDDDGSESARRMLPFVEDQGVMVPALGVAAAAAFLGLRTDDVRLEGDRLLLGNARMPLLDEPAPGDNGSTQPSRQVLLRFPRPAGPLADAKTMFPVYSFYNVLLSGDQVAGGKPPAVPASALAGKVVFVGSSAAGSHERVATPFAGGAAGIELHATMAENILANMFMRRASRTTDLTVTVLAGVTAGVIATLLPVGAGVGVVVALVAALLLWLNHEVAGGVWIGAVMPAGAAGLALFGGVAWRYFVEDREKRHVRRMFSRYVSRDVVDQLMEDPALAGLGGQRREMTVLFSDIRNFTTATEAGTPEGVVTQLNEYFGAMVEVLFRHQGTLDKFVGDMVMGLFGAPLADPRHADHAVLTALEMMQALEGLNAKWRAEGKPAVDIGIGINTGEMIAGNIGSEAIMSYTVIGDAVNLGSRLESLNKEYGTHILISEATRARLTIPVETRFVGDVTVKGKTKAVGVYEVRGQSPQ